MATINDIEIHTDIPGFRYQPLRRLEVTCEASNLLMPAPTIEEVNGRLRALAAKIGANAVIDVSYNSGVSFTSWKSLKGKGLAVIRETDDIACPNCAETIKRAARICRFCGHSLVDDEAAEPPVERQTESVQLPQGEPLREHNNPAILVGLIGFMLFLFWALVTVLR